MTDDRQWVADAGNERKWFHMLPNMADDDLNPYEYRLYGHYKRVCGENGGDCTESVRETAKTCKMSVGMVSKTRQQLEDKGWIAVRVMSSMTENGKRLYEGTIISLNDRWMENIQRYSGQESQKDKLAESLRETCSPDEHPRSQDEHGCSPHETKKNYIKNSSSNEEDNGASPDGARRASAARAFPIGTTVYYVDEPHLGVHEVLEGQVVRYTPKKVWVRFGDAERCLFEHALRMDKPELKRQTDRLEDGILYHILKIGPDQQVGARTMTFVREVKSNLLATFPNLPVELFHAAAKSKHPYIPSEIPKIVKMVGDYLEQRKKAPSKSPPPPSPDELMMARALAPETDHVQ